MNNKTSRKEERGSAFFYILLGVILFGTLAYVVSKGIRGQVTTALTDRQAELAASEIINYGRKVELAVQRLLQNGCSEEELSFENNSVSGYENTVSPKGDNTCHIFHADGAALRWQEPPEGVSDNHYSFNARNVINGLGSECYGSTRCTELAMFLSNIDLNVCEAVNDFAQLSPTTPPIDSNHEFSDNLKFYGNFGSNSGVYDDAGLSDGKRTLCMQENINPATYHFYHVLIER